MNLSQNGINHSRGWKLDLACILFLWVLLLVVALAAVSLYFDFGAKLAREARLNHPHPQVQAERLFEIEEERYNQLLTTEAVAPEQIETELRDIMANLEYVVAIYPFDEKAFFLLYTILSYQDNEAEGLCWLGEYYLKNKLLPEAEESFKTSLTIQPDNLRAIGGLALTYSTRGDLSRSRAILTEAYDRKHLRNQYYLLALIGLREKTNLKGSSNLTQTMQFLTDYYQMNPHNYYVVGLLADYYFKADKVDRAISLYREYLQFNPYHTTALNKLARLLKTQQLYDEALELLQRGVTIAPRNPVLLFYLGELYFKLGNSRKAEYYRKQAIARKPAFAARPYK